VPPDLSAAADRAVALCQQLLRVDTTNPPGAEAAAVALCAEALAEGGDGLETTVLESAPTRANLVSRLRGDGSAPPLLLSAHLDVVPADVERWRHPPFGGEEHDGWLWGRGAVDMKHMAAMSCAILVELAKESARSGRRPRRDVIFAAVADEEAGCDHGSRFLVEKHPELVRAEFALGEVGGFSMRLGPLTVYPVMIAEKGIAWLRARVRGAPGHGSMPRSDSAVVRLAAAIGRLGKTRLPAHPTRTIGALLETLTQAAPAPLDRLPLAELMRGGVLDGLLRLLPDKGLGRELSALLANTATPTVLRAGSKINVIPGVAEAELDGRVLPGQTVDDLVRELRSVLGADVELEVLRAAPPVELWPYRTPLYDLIAEVVPQHHRGAVVAPFLIPGFTDAKQWSRLGTRCYGFTPLQLPTDGSVRFADLFHGDDERVPVDGLRWGVRVLADVLQRFCF
jgi:acetylornithine deacetylase/succinyl-diaminopimelate desuccinylase-like protein